MTLPLNGSHCGLTHTEVEALRAELTERAQIERIGIRFDADHVVTFPAE